MGGGMAIWISVRKRGVFRLCWFRVESEASLVTLVDMAFFQGKGFLPLESCTFG